MIHCGDDECQWSLWGDGQDRLGHRAPSDGRLTATALSSSDKRHVTLRLSAFTQCMVFSDRRPCTDLTLAMNRGRWQVRWNAPVAWGCWGRHGSRPWQLAQWPPFLPYILVGQEGK